jgi:hypothetical protein
MRIPALATLIAKCWTRAEQGLRDEIKQRFPDRDEDKITELFQGQLRAECDNVSATGAVEEAFLADLHQSLPNAAEADLSKISRGLIATVLFHPTEIEKRTGGDFGIVLVRPDVRLALYSHSELTIDHEYERGLLCQAKVFGRKSKWGTLNENQVKVLAESLSYLSLVLYRYADQKGERRELAPFSWQLTGGVNVEDIKGWLRSGRFPKLEESGQILSALARNEIGTDDKPTISTHIAPALRPSLKISIRWRDDKGPGDSVRIQNSATAQRHEIVIQRG